MDRQLARTQLTHEDLERLAEVVQQRLHGRVREFHLALRDDGLVLKGFSPTYYMKQLAQHAVMEAAGVPIRANEIEVAL